MSLKAYILADYQEAIALNTSIPAELRRSLKTNERVPIFLERLAAQLDQIERRKLNLSRMRIKSIVYDMTDFFVNNLKRKIDMDTKSKIANQSKSGVELAAQLDDQGNGEVPELGIIIRDRANEKNKKTS